MALIAAFGFGAGSGSTIADDSGNGHTLTLGAASFTASGHTGPGLANTTAATGASAAVPSVAGPVTLMAWVKPLDLGSGTSHLICGVIQPGGSTDIGLFTQRGDFGASNVQQGNLRINGNLTAANGAAMTVDEWTHVALTYDGSTLKLWRDGVVATSVSNAGTVSLATTLYVAGATGFDSDVVVDDVRYFDSDESANITTLMNTPVAPPATSGMKLFNGTAWVDSGQPKLFSGSAWVTAGTAQLL